MNRYHAPHIPNTMSNLLGGMFQSRHPGVQNPYMRRTNFNKGNHESLELRYMIYGSSNLEDIDIKETFPEDSNQMNCRIDRATSPIQEIDFSKFNQNLVSMDKRISNVEQILQENALLPQQKDQKSIQQFNKYSSKIKSKEVDRLLVQTKELTKKYQTFDACNNENENYPLDPKNNDYDKRAVCAIEESCDEINNKSTSGRKSPTYATKQRRLRIGQHINGV